MRKLLQYLLKRPLTWMGNKLAASPKEATVFESLTQLYNLSKEDKGNTVKLVEAHIATDKFIIFSDQHKGNRSWADDFKMSEINYVAALTHYHEQGYTFINLGDSEELWKFTATEILPLNENVLAAEAAFHPSRYIKAFGNHDLMWKNKLDVIFYLNKYYAMPLPVYEGVLIKLKGLSKPLNVFLTHGHQGDLMSDNNALSTWIVAHIWMPLQRFLRININTASKDFSLRNLHNKMMYAWSSRQRDMILITGHTHSPVFASGKYLKHPSNYIPAEDKEMENLNPSYFNSGCCCFDDGDITGIEIEGGKIRLIKWYDEEVKSRKKILEEITLEQLMKDIPDV